jgi:ubiquinone/menaquinone biosynthesis C-methylase UbiE
MNPMVSIGRPLSRVTLAAEAERLQAAYAQRQDLSSWASSGHLFSHQARERRALGLLKRYGFLPLAEKLILDVGCGSGGWIQQLVRWGAQPEHITGLDLLPDRLERARQRVPSAVRLEAGNAAELPFPDAAFDLVLQSTMFTSVLDPDVRRTIASEMLRVLRPGGLILWYDFHVTNPWNADVRPVTKQEIRELFSGCRIELRRITLLPRLARWLAPRSWLLTYLLSGIPLLCTHYLGAITKRANPSAT